MVDVATSLVLRFRDLVTERNGTIGQHEALASETGHIWWGWWHKGGERAAVHEYARLLKNKPVEILLLDSGQAKLYRATWTDIEVSTDDQIPSPAPTKTPTYYRDQKYLAWYKLSGFSHIPQEETDAILRSLTYVCVNEFFEDSKSPFGAFYGKRIYSAQEMIQQNRTVWFTRAAETTDPSHEITLLNAEHVRPHNFAPLYFSTPSPYVLWLSDLHFSKERKHHGFPEEVNDQDHNLWLALETALKAQKVDRLAGVIVSGDITWCADPGEFGQAQDFFDRLISSFSLDPRQLAICPGNHDIAFSEEPARKGARITRAVPASEKAFRDFYERMFRIAPNNFLSSGRRLLVAGALPVDIVSVNSSLLQQHPDFRRDDGESQSPIFQGQGFVGAAQLLDAADQFCWDSDSYSPVRALRVVVLHHHLLPVTEAESAVAGGTSSVVLDAERLARWLVRHRVDLVLHGHQHQPFSVKVTRSENFLKENASDHTFHILGAGSAGVCQAHLGPIAKNTFTLIKFNDTHINAKYFSVHCRNESETISQISIPYATSSAQRAK